MKSRNEQRYEIFKKVVSANRSRNLSRDNILTTYMSVINKASTEREVDEALDAIIENERQIKITGKGNL